VRQCGLRDEHALHRRMGGQDAPVPPGLFARVLGQLNVAGGQGRYRRRDVAEARGKSAQLGGRLDGRVGRGSSGIGLTLRCESGALTCQA
jgi:hypothetical protein